MDLEGFPAETVVRVTGLSDVLMAISGVEFLRDRLALYGGTALNLIHVRSLPRLSVDIDYNFRHIDDEDWGKVREHIDEGLKDVLQRLGYQNDDIAIQPRYNLTRFMTRKRTPNGLGPWLKVETGFMRRIPVLAEDTPLDFEHPVTGLKATVLTPKKEELFANKFCTMLSRPRPGEAPSPRDVFDVATISRQEMDMGLFLDVVMVEGLLSELDLDVIDARAIGDVNIKNMKDMVRGELDTKGIVNDAVSFTRKVLEACIGKGWTEFNRAFIKNGTVRTDLLSGTEHMNPDLEGHPQLLWLRKKRSSMG